MNSTKQKASEIFSKEEITRIKNVLEVFDGKVIAIYDTPKNEKEAKAQRRKLVALREPEK